MRYRPEIDGLRAVAVLPVIFFHAGFNFFSGGYIGVDVFFVISGYLITTIILEDFTRGEFSIAKFYERRARRILPALFSVMLLCIPFAWVWMHVTDMTEFGKALGAVSIFSSNFLYLRLNGYFDSAVEIKPLLHTWSLAVEEQFYLIFPLFFLFLLRNKRIITFSLIFILLLSFISQQWIYPKNQAAAYYLIPFRCWELIFGALAAWFSFENKEKFSALKNKYQLSISLASLLGLFLILASSLLYSKNTPYPSAYTLIPVIGAVLIIVSASSENLTGRMLGSSILVGVGLISYSAYLLHQPIFAFARIRSVDEPSSILFGALTVLTLTLAYFSWRYIEAPFRTAKFSRRFIFLISLIGIVSYLSLGLYIKSKEGLPGRLPVIYEAQFSPQSTADATNCKPIFYTESKYISVCEFGDISSTRAVALYGDSHAGALVGALDSKFKEKNIRGIRLFGRDGCNIIPGLIRDGASEDSIEEQKKCFKARDAILSYVEGSVESVIISIRWTYHLYPINGQIDRLAYNNQEGGIEYDISMSFKSINPDGDFILDDYGYKDFWVNKLISSFEKTNKKIVILYPIPEVGWHVSNFNFKNYLENGSPPAVISTSYDNFKTRNRLIYQVLDNYQGRSNLIRFKPENVFCNTYLANRCVAQYDMKPLYHDDDHLSNAGAELLIQRLVDEVRIY